MPDTQTPRPDTVLSPPFLVSTHRPSKRRVEKNGSDFQKQWQGVGPRAAFRATKASIFFDKKAVSLRNKRTFLFPVCSPRQIEMPARRSGVLKQQCSALARGIKTWNKSRSCVLGISRIFAYIGDNFECSLAILHTTTQKSVPFTPRYKNLISDKRFDELCSQSY